jgi:hypothetical protein
MGNHLQKNAMGTFSSHLKAEKKRIWRAMPGKRNGKWLQKAIYELSKGRDETHGNVETKNPMNPLLRARKNIEKNIDIDCQRCYNIPVSRKRYAHFKE